MFYADKNVCINSLQPWIIVIYFLPKNQSNVWFESIKTVKLNNAQNHFLFVMIY